MLKDSGRFLEAQREYESILEVTPEDGETFLQLGHLSRQKGDLIAAQAYYKQACSVADRSEDAVRELQNLTGTGGLPPSLLPDIMLLANKKTSFRQKPTSEGNSVPRLEANLAALRADLEQLKATAFPQSGDLGAMTNRNQALLTELENRWNSFVPMMLNMSSALARLGHEISELSRRIDKLEELPPAKAPHRQSN
jgi:tetratricopeptide (TPR) repeat protein